MKRGAEEASSMLSITYQTLRAQLVRSGETWRFICDLELPMPESLRS